MLFPDQHPHLTAYHIVKFRGASPVSSKVMGMHTLHLKPIFDPPLEKMLKEPLSLVGCALANLSYSVSRVKISECSTS